MKLRLQLCALAFLFGLAAFRPWPLLNKAVGLTPVAAARPLPSVDSINVVNPDVVITLPAAALDTFRTSVREEVAVALDNDKAPARPTRARRGPRPSDADDELTSRQRIRHIEAQEGEILAGVRSLVKNQRPPKEVYGPKLPYKLRSGRADNDTLSWSELARQGLSTRKQQ